MPGFLAIGHREQNIYERLLQFSQLIEKSKTRLEWIGQLQEKDREDRKQQLSQALVPYEQMKRKINAFIALSNSRMLGAQPIQATQREPVDLDLLGRLHVQMTGSRDPSAAAAELYRHAKGQLLQLDADMSVFTERFRNVENAELIEMRNNVTASVRQAYKTLCEEVRNLVENADQSAASGAFDTYAGSAILPVALPELYMEGVADILRTGAVTPEGLSADLWVDPNAIGCTCIQYNQDTYRQIRLLVQSLIIQTGRTHKEALQRVLYADPYRMSNPDLEPLTVVEDGWQSIVTIPRSGFEIKEGIKHLYSAAQHDEAAGLKHYFLCVLDGYPEEYDSETSGIIRALCFNAQRLNVCMVLLQNLDSRQHRGNDSFPFAVQRIKLQENNTLTLQPEFCPAPAKVRLTPVPVIRRQDLNYFIREKVSENMDNRYETRVSMAQFPMRPKGTKSLSNLPYAISEHGDLLTTSLSFGYVYGITGSGKSTLLHTLISSIITTVHPDDVELWLVDFKMVEFKRYINNCPPHVRCVILDNSPEMALDLLDRLHRIIKNRERDFAKYNWHSVHDAQKAGVYKPVIFVIIDEFPVMSGIISESYVHKDKMSDLLKLGRQLGVFLLFSGQSFTSGITGLASSAKQQIDWRAVMHGPKDEISATLELSNASDRDKELMGSLPPHHVLMKRKKDSDGNQLDFGKVLYFGIGSEGEANQWQWEQKAAEGIRVDRTFSPTDQHVCFDKRPEFYDGYSYVSFESQKPLFQQHIDEQARSRDPVLYLFPGQPRNMQQFSAIELRPSKEENLLICSNPEQIDEVGSLVLSIAESLKLNTTLDCHASAICVTADGNMLHLDELLHGRGDVAMCEGKEAAAEQIRKVYRRLLDRKYGYEVLFLIDYVTIAEMAEAMDDEKIQRTKNAAQEGAMWFLKGDAPVGGKNPFQKMDDGDPPDPPGAFPADDSDDDVSNASLAEMLETIIANGARYGCFVVAVFKTTRECALTRVHHQFVHQVFFKGEKDDVSLISSIREGGYVQNMSACTFRYAGHMSYRPYLHPGIEINGHRMDGDHTAESEGPKSELE